MPALSIPIQYITYGYIALALLTIALRVITHLHFSGLLITLSSQTKKPIEKKEDVPKIKNALLRKIIGDYIHTAEKLTTAVPLSQIIGRELSRKSLLGWKYYNIMPLVKSMELGLLLVGAMVAIAKGYEPFVMLTIAVFLATKAMAAFFNADAKKETLAQELHIYIAREIGQFFPNSTPGAVLGLKTELSNAIKAQTAALEPLSAQLPALSQAMETIKTTAELTAANQKAMAAALTAYETYEDSLKNITTTMGESLGTFIDLHAQTSAKAIADALKTASPGGTHGTY